MSGHLCADVVVAGCMLAQTLLQLQLALHQVLVLPLEQHLAIEVVIEQLLIQHAYEGVRVTGHVFADFSLGVAELLDDCLDDSLVKVSRFDILVVSASRLVI